ncbi:hypothetical protein Ciccas_008746 [Cichlidogyrus casuarinus]|uniref:Uncharacterized protein n=1 Tax=Cichlidogyrus casuarinus TaxID=1844966 RepID=A0ABD2PZ47_9PLAT
MNNKILIVFALVFSLLIVGGESGYCHKVGKECGLSFKSCCPGLYCSKTMMSLMGRCMPSYGMAAGMPMGGVGVMPAMPMGGVGVMPAMPMGGVGMMPTMPMGGMMPMGTGMMGCLPRKGFCMSNAQCCSGFCKIYKNKCV